MQSPYPKGSYNDLTFHQFGGSAPEVNVRDFVSGLTSGITANDPMLADTALWVEEHAVRFYLLNDLVSRIVSSKGKNGVLTFDEQTLVSHYAEYCSRLARICAEYVFTICTREARHLQKRTDFFKDLTSGFVPGVEHLSKSSLSRYRGFIGRIPRNKGKENVVTQIHNSSPDVLLADYLLLVEKTFEFGSFQSSYGGKPWKNIAAALRRLADGSYGIESFLDTVWTLSHNCAPIFDKGHHFLTPIQHDLVMILDLQRAGQIPTLMLDPMRDLYFAGSCPTYPSLGGAMDQVMATFDYPKSVDWELVKNLGAIGFYDFKDLTPPKPQFWVTPDLGLEIYDREAA